MGILNLASATVGGNALQARLHEVAITSPDPSGLAAFYTSALGFAFHAERGEMAGRTFDRRIRIASGPPKELLRATFAVDDPSEIEALRDRLLTAGYEVSMGECPGHVGETISFRDPDGNRLLFGIPVEDDGDLDGSEPGKGVGALPARLQHVVLASTDIDVMLCFYSDVVGFGLSDRVVNEEGVLKSAFLRCSHEHHSLALFAASANRLDHWCHEAGDWLLIRDWADHFAQLRVPLQWGPGRHGPGNNLFLFVHDPDGNWIELSAELEHVAADRPTGIWHHEERTLNQWGPGKLRV